MEKRVVCIFRRKGFEIKCGRNVGVWRWKVQPRLLVKTRTCKFFPPCKEFFRKRLTAIVSSKHRLYMKIRLADFSIGFGRDNHAIVVIRCSTEPGGNEVYSMVAGSKPRIKKILISAPRQNEIVTPEWIK
jgi:hypothetical protein